ncbi:MAG: hypothetical protein ACLTEH_02660 [Clostridia bacterium]
MDKLQAEIEKQIQVIKQLIERPVEKEKIRKEKEKLDDLLKKFLKEK